MNCELVEGFVIGLVTSGIVALLAVKTSDCRKRKGLKKKFGKLDGVYKGYRFEKAGVEKDEFGRQKYKNILEDKPHSEATIKYLNENVLEIYHFEFETKHEWEGQIKMDLETSGSIVWRYNKISNQDSKEKHIFGLKRCIVREDLKEGKMYLYLIGEERYGKEILIKKI